MLELGILKTWNSTTHKAGVQLVGSLTTYLDDISVSVSIASSAMVVGNYVLVAIPGGNPRDACVVASWPAGSSGGGGGSKIQDADGDTSWDTEQSADEDKIHGKVKGVEAFLLDDAGVLTLAKQSAARAELSSPQTIPADIETWIEYDVAVFDAQSELDITTNHQFVAKTAGYYFASVTAGFINIGEDVNYAPKIYKNGTYPTANSGTAICRTNVSKHTADYEDFQGHTIVYLGVGDNLYATIKHLDSVARSLPANGRYNNFIVVKLF